jgi:hypothetical protein
METAMPIVIDRDLEYCEATVADIGSPDPTGMVPVVASFVESGPIDVLPEVWFLSFESEPTPASGLAPVGDEDGTGTADGLEG